MLPLYWFNTLPLNNRKSYSTYIKLFLILTYQYYLVIENRRLAVLVYHIKEPLITVTYVTFH